MKNLQELFVDQLKDVHNAEKQLIKALPRMAKAATTAALRKAFEDHLAVTREQVARLDAVFEEVGARPGRKKCAAMEGLVQEGEELIAEQPAREVLDAGLIAAAQRVEHYEIAAYGTLRSYAKVLGHKNAVKLLEKTLKEEEATDQLLSNLAEGGINEKAVSPPEDQKQDRGKTLVGKAINAVAEATGLASEPPKKAKARKGSGTGRKGGG
jgi:ferritin-like metal-binding protein YciE